MSQLIYPTLPGLAFSVEKTPLWSTMRKSTASGRSYRGTFAQYPSYRFKLAYEFLRDSSALPELKTLLGFFNQLSGGFDTFLFTDPDDCTVVGQGTGIGDGTNKTFQLRRTLGGFVDPIYDLNGTPTIYVNGVATTAYTLSAGALTFTTAPAAGAALTWDGSYYWRCAFDNDELPFSKFAQQLWEAKTVQFTSVKP